MAEVACSRELLEVVVSNLVGNALELVEGRERRRVRVSSRRIEEGCEISVEDSGPGIAPELQARVFEPFHRVPGTRTRGRGSARPRRAGSSTRTAVGSR